MIELFSLSVIRYLNAQLDNEAGVEVYMADSNDSQNAIAFTHAHGTIYYHLSVDVARGVFILTSIYLDTDLQIELDEKIESDKMSSLIEKMLYQINQLK